MIVGGLVTLVMGVVCADMWNRVRRDPDMGSGARLVSLAGLGLAAVSFLVAGVVLLFRAFS